MGQSADKIDVLKKRNAERLAKADAYTEKKGDSAKAIAKAHARIGNDVDAVVTAGGSKTLGMAIGAAWGAVKGTFIGVPLGFMGAALMPLGFVTPFLAYFAVTFAYNVVKGARDGYYKREMNSPTLKGKELGDRIAASGNGQMKPIKQEIREKAVSKAKNEIPDTPVEELEEISHPTEVDVEPVDTTWRDRIDSDQGTAVSVYRR